MKLVENRFLISIENRTIHIHYRENLKSYMFQYGPSRSGFNTELSELSAETD
jgi:hypothetical protein